MTPEHVVRAMVDADRGFVSAAWFKGAAEAEPACYMARARYDVHQRRHVDWCLDNADTLIACHPDAPDELFGFVCFEWLAAMPPIVHWIYVRRMFRRSGIAASLLRHAIGGALPPAVISTQWSKHSDWIRRRIRLVFDPYLVPERMASRVA